MAKRSNSHTHSTGGNSARVTKSESLSRTSRRPQDFIHDFDEFWERVGKAEVDIRLNAHLGRLPPCCIGDPWDEDFAASYKRIRPLLLKFRRHRFFSVPAGLMFFPGPLRAETAHQAIMFYLNPPRELYGEAHALDSQEYIEMKREAMEELQDRDIARLKRSMKRSAPKALDSEAPPPLEAPDISSVEVASQD
jgi:hypothetical protein